MNEWDIIDSLYDIKELRLSKQYQESDKLRETLNKQQVKVSYERDGSLIVQFPPLSDFRMLRIK